MAVLCFKYAESHGIKEGGIALGEIYSSKLSYPSCPSEALRYRRIKKGKEVRDKRSEAKHEKLRAKKYYTQNGEGLRADLYKMEH